MRIRAFVLLLFILVTSGLSADLALLLQTADSLSASGNYYQAITEYKRYLCYAQPELVNPNTFRSLALCYREQGDQSKALQTIEAAISRAADSTQRAGFTIDKAIILMTAKNYSLAEFILLRLTLMNKSPEIAKRARFFLTLDYILQGKWAEAKNTLDLLASGTPLATDPDLIRTSALLETFALEKPKDLRLAKLLSSIVPGIGQAYSGDFQNATNSFLINAGIGGWLVYNALQKNYWSLVPIALLGWKYYQGSRYHAERIARETNSDLRQEHVVEALQAFYPLLDCLER